MTVLVFTILVFLGSMLAGFLGSLTGLGGGVIIIPLLVLGFGVDINYASGASLVSVIATSSGAAAAYVRQGYSNVRIGMFLEIATTLGAIGGAFLAAWMTGSMIAILFGIILIISAYLSSSFPPNEECDQAPDPLATRLRLHGTYPTADGLQFYSAYRVPQGFALMTLAGGLSGLLGIGSGAFKVLALDFAMKLPFKVSTTTSNFMIGVTAAASAGVYLNRGYIDPGLVMPVMLGVVAGSYLGPLVLARTQIPVLRRVFSVVILMMAIQMIYHGITGKI